MSKRLDNKDYQNHLAEQICFLQSSAKLYDMGNKSEAKRMAVTSRVLIWGDEAKSPSKSLLGQMQLKKKMAFISTAQKYDKNNLLSQQCLLSMQLGPNGLRYHPLFENDNRFRKLSYVDWVSEIVISDNKHNTYSRKDIIKLLANQDGGAHVDTNISTSLAPMKSPDFGGWQMCSPDGTVNYGNNPVYATMRQITFEMLQSLHLIRPLSFKEAYF